MRRSDIQNLYDQIRGIENPAFRRDFLNYMLNYLQSFAEEEMNQETKNLLTFYLTLYDQEISITYV